MTHFHSLQKVLRFLPTYCSIWFITKTSEFKEQESGQGRTQACYTLVPSEVWLENILQYHHCISKFKFLPIGMWKSMFSTVVWHNLLVPWLGKQKRCLACRLNMKCSGGSPVLMSFVSSFERNCDSKMTVGLLYMFLISLGISV